MQFTLVTAALALATVTSASHVARDGFCPNGASLLCCNSLVPVPDPNVTALTGLLGIPESDVIGPYVGVTCSPVSVIGIGGNVCTAVLACCTDNSYNGIVAFGCRPVIVDL